MKTVQKFQTIDFFKRSIFEEVGDDYFSGPITLERLGIEIEVDFSIFLNGRCDEFAVALVRRYGGSLAVVTHHDDEGRFLNLAHVYAVKSLGQDNQAIVDIRGRIQSDSDLSLMEYFEDFYFGDNLYEQMYSLEEGIEVLCELLKISSEAYEEDNLKEANRILEWFEEKYRY